MQPDDASLDPDQEAHDSGFGGLQTNRKAKMLYLRDYAGNINEQAALSYTRATVLWIDDEHFSAPSHVGKGAYSEKPPFSYVDADNFNTPARLLYSRRFSDELFELQSKTKEFDIVCCDQWARNASGFSFIDQAIQRIFTTVPPWEKVFLIFDIQENGPYGVDQHAGFNGAFSALVEAGAAMKQRNPDYRLPYAAVNVFSITEQIPRVEVDISIPTNHFCKNNGTKGVMALRQEVDKWLRT